MSTTLWEQQEQKSLWEQQEQNLRQRHRRKVKHLQARIDREQQLLSDLQDKFMLLLDEQQKNHGKVLRSALVQLLPDEARKDENFKLFRKNLVALFSQFLQAHPCAGLVVEMIPDGVSDSKGRLAWRVISLPPAITDAPSSKSTASHRPMWPLSKSTVSYRPTKMWPLSKSTVSYRPMWGSNRIDSILFWSPFPDYSRCSRTSRWCALHCCCK